MKEHKGYTVTALQELLKAICGARKYVGSFVQQNRICSNNQENRFCTNTKWSCLNVLVILAKEY